MTTPDREHSHAKLVLFAIQQSDQLLPLSIASVIVEFRICLAKLNPILKKFHDAVFALDYSKDESFCCLQDLVVDYIAVATNPMHALFAWATVIEVLPRDIGVNTNLANIFFSLYKHNYLSMKMVFHDIPEIVIAHMDLFYCNQNNSSNGIIYANFINELLDANYNPFTIFALTKFYTIEIENPLVQCVYRLVFENITTFTKHSLEIQTQIHRMVTQIFDNVPNDVFPVRIDAFQLIEELLEIDDVCVLPRLPLEPLLVYGLKQSEEEFDFHSYCVTFRLLACIVEETNYCCESLFPYLQSFDCNEFFPSSLDTSQSPEAIHSERYQLCVDWTYIMLIVGSRQHQPRMCLDHDDFFSTILIYYFLFDIDNLPGHVKLKIAEYIILTNIDYHNYFQNVFNFHSWKQHVLTFLDNCLAGIDLNEIDCLSIELSNFLQALAPDGEIETDLATKVYESFPHDSE